MIENQIATLDPLRLDEHFPDFPDHNLLADISSISKIAILAVEAADAPELKIPDPATAAACLRDLDFCASSITRHGEDPMQLVMGLEAVMQRMGAAAGTVPRSTVATFAAANPDGPRKRSYTGTREEELFTTVLKNTYGPLEAATMAVGKIDLCDPDRDPLRDALRIASLGMQVMIDSTIQVKRNITPEVFSGVIRPYFEPLTIGGEEYHAPNGGQLQLTALEAMLFHGQGSDEERQRFFEDNYHYLTPVQRRAVDDFRGQNNGLSVLEYLTQQARIGALDVDTTGLLLHVVRGVRKFRYPHLKVTEDNFAIRADGAVGSGSYTPEALRLLLDKTNCDMTALLESLGSSE